MAYIKELSDEILLGLLIKGDAGAFGELYCRYVKTLYNYTYRLLQNKERSQDIVQDTFIELWNKRANCEAILNIKAYLIGCVRLKAKRSFQFEDKFSVSGHEDLIEKFFSEFPIDELIITEENYRRVISFLQTQFELLPKREHEALHLRFYEGLSFEEISIIIDIAPQSVRNTIGKGLEKLRQNLPKSLFFSTIFLVNLFI